MCGPGMMSQTVNEVLDSLGVDPSSIHYDNFG
jgi:Na+-transporting NADH:ubiquinone oxidoreductase subunit F